MTRIVKVDLIAEHQTYKMTTSSSFVYDMTVMEVPLPKLMACSSKMTISDDVRYVDKSSGPCQMTSRTSISAASAIGILDALLSCLP